MVRWLWRGENTRYHSELGRENPQRRWYFVLRHGRVGRCRALKSQLLDAGWSSLVARQAHNLKVVGSNPTPATNLLAKKSNNFSLHIKNFFDLKDLKKLRAFFFLG